MQDNQTEINQAKQEQEEQKPEEPKRPFLFTVIVGANIFVSAAVLILFFVNPVIKGIWFGEGIAVPPLKTMLLALLVLIPYIIICVFLWLGYKWARLAAIAVYAAVTVLIFFPKHGLMFDFSSENIAMAFPPTGLFLFFIFDKETRKFCRK